MERKRDKETEEDSQSKSSETSTENTKGHNEKLDQYIHQAQVLMEQVNQLYNMYATGVEKKPPLEKFKQLEQVMSTLQHTDKLTPIAAFKFHAVQSSFVSHRERWERLLKAIEKGKVKRQVIPEK